MEIGIAAILAVCGVILIATINFDYQRSQDIEEIKELLKDILDKLKDDD